MGIKGSFDFQAPEYCHICGGMKIRLDGTDLFCPVHPAAGTVDFLLMLEDALSGK